MQLELSTDTNYLVHTIDSGKLTCKAVGGWTAPSSKTAFGAITVASIMTTTAISIDAICGTACTIEIGLTDNLELEGDGPFTVNSSIGRDGSEVVADCETCHLSIHTVHVVITVEAVNIVDFHK